MKEHPKYPKVEAVIVVWADRWLNPWRINKVR